MTPIDPALSRQPARGLLARWRRLSLRRIVFTVVLATWALRALYLCMPDPLSIDEVSALSASEYSTASAFAATANWAERWDIANQFRQWHILWIAPHLVWGFLFPSNGQMAYGLTYLMAVVALGAFALAGRRLYGERGFLLCALMASVSPLFLTYTVRPIGTMPAVMWLCIALVLFTGPRWSAWQWMGGGMCFGLAFGASFGAGAAILAMSAGLAASVARVVLQGAIPWRQRFWKCVVCPLLGIGGAILPLLPVELSARFADDAYAGFLLHHTMLVLNAWLGPYGLWLREMVELDPLLEVGIVVAAVYSLRGQAFSRFTRIMLAVAYAILLGLVVVALDQAAWRVFISLGVFAAVGVAIGASRVLERDALAERQDGEAIPEAPAVHPAVFDQHSLVVSVVVLVAFLTLWRNLSNMARLPFPGWPLMVLGLVGLLLRGLAHHYGSLVRGTAVLGGVLFCIAAALMFDAKGAHSRARVYAAQHDYLAPVRYQDLWATADMAKYFGMLSRRARADVTIFGPPATWYPVVCYEEDPYKLILYRDAIQRFGIAGVISGEQVFYSLLLFEPSTRIAGAPPPGTPEIPDQVSATGIDGRPFAPPAHPYRGFELRFSRRPTGDHAAEMSATVVLPVASLAPGSLGFEYLAKAPSVPFGTQLTISVFQGDRVIASTAALITVSEGRKADGSLPMYTIAPPSREPFHLFQSPIRPATNPQAVRIVARLQVDSHAPWPAVSLYIRRPYIDLAPAT